MFRYTKALLFFSLFLTVGLFLPIMAQSTQEETIALQMEDGQMVWGVLKGLDDKVVHISLINQDGDVVIPIKALAMRQQSYLLGYRQQAKPTRFSECYVSAVHLITNDGRSYIGDMVEKPKTGPAAQDRYTPEMFLFIKAKGEILPVKKADIHSNTSIKINADEVMTPAELFEKKYRDFPPDPTNPIPDHLAFAEYGMKTGAFDWVENQLDAIKTLDKDNHFADKVAVIRNGLSLTRQNFFLKETLSQANIYGVRADPLSALMYLDQRLDEFSQSTFKDPVEGGPDVSAEIATKHTEMLETLKTKALSSIFKVYRESVVSILDTHLGAAEAPTVEASVAYAQSARDSKMAAIALVPDKITASLTDDLSKENAVSPEIIADFIRKTGIKESDAGQMLRKTTLGSLSDRAKKITDYMQQMDITPKGLQAIIDQGPPKQSITLTLSGMEAVFFTSPTVKYSVRNIPKEALPTCTDRATWWAKASKTDKKDYLLALHLNKVFQMDTKTNVCPACQGTGEIEMNIDKNATRRATDPTIAASYEKQKVTCTSCWGTKIDRVTLTVK